MADLQQLERALINADKAGDTQAAKILAREIRKQRNIQPKTSTGVDMARSLGTGVRDAIEGMAGSPADLRDIGSNVAQWGARKLGASDTTAANIGTAARLLSPFAFAPTSSQIRKETTGVIGPGYEPQTTAGEYSRTVGQFAPAAFTPGGPLTKAANVLAPALVSETAGQMTKGTSVEPYARLVGAVGGASIPTLLKRAATPLPISRERQAMVDILRREGVPVTAGQKTGRELLKFAESELGGGKAGALFQQQADDFTAAVLRKAGVEGKKATPEVIDKGLKTIGQSFDDLASRNSITPDQRLIDDVIGIVDDYRANVGEASQAKIVQNVADDIFNQARKGDISGKFYQSTTSQLFKKARAGSDADKSGALRDMREALDSAMERSIAAKNPADLGAWQEARRQYRNILVVEKAAAGAGEGAAMGAITPQKLRQATTSTQGTRAYARGQGDFAELSRAGNAIMSTVPQSGTAPRAFVRGVPAATAGALGTGVTGDVMTGLAMGVAAPWAAGRTLMSRPVQSYLTNQAFAKPGMMDQQTRAALAALLARPSLAPPAQ